MRRVLSPGETLHSGRFRIEKVLGEGGEGVVYAAFDQLRYTTVALKTLHLDGSCSTSALKREFRLLQGLIHPGLVHLHELFVGADHSFFSMGYVPGRPFSELGDDAETLRDALVQLADALDFLHRRGRVHRDIKASNVIVQDDGRVVLVDFGVAVDLSMRRAALEEAVGTPLYMAPEVRLGDEATPRSDAYSLGVLVYETLTGKHPFLGSHSGERKASEPRPSRISSNVPEDLDQLCVDLLRFDPQQRATIGDVLDRLGGVVSWTTFEAERPSRREQRPLAGRGRHLAMLEESFQLMQKAREPVVVFVEGESGMGKTVLVERFLERRKRDSVVFRSRCMEREFVWHKAFDGVLDDLVMYLSSRTEDDVLTIVSPEDARALAPLFPQVASLRSLGHLVPDVEMNEEPQRKRQRAYDALATVLGRLGKHQPLVIHIDDLQWGDLDSARLIYDVFSRQEATPCLLLLGFRTEARKQSACLRELLDGRRCIMDELRGNRIVVGPLNDAETDGLVESLLGSANAAAPWLESIRQASRGSPLLVTELAMHAKGRAIEDGGLARFGIVEIVEARLAGSSPGARSLFEFACLGGGGLPLWLARQLLPDVSLDATVSELMLNRLVREEEGGARIQPSHDAIREAGEQLMGSRAPQLHRRVAEQLVAGGADAALIARHYAASDEPQRCADWASQAASAAAEALAFDQAATLYRLALEHQAASARWTLEARLADVLADGGRGIEAAPLYLELSREASDKDALDYRCRAAAQWLIGGEIQRGQEVLRDVFSELGLEWHSSPKGAIYQLLKNRARLKFAGPDDPRQVPTLAERDKQRFDACRAAWSVGYVSTIHGAANSAQYLLLAKKLGDREHLAHGYGMEALYRATQGTPRAPVVEDYIERARKLMPEPRTVPRHAFLKYVESQSHYLLGRHLEAVEAYEAADDLFVSGCKGVAWEMNSSRIFWASSLYYLGRHLELDRRIERWILDAREREDKYCYTALEILKARRLGMPDGQWDEAYELVQAAMEQWRSPYYGVHDNYEVLFLAQAALCQGRPELCLEIMEQMWRDMKRAMMHRVQVVRVFRAHYAAFGALGAANNRRGAQRKSYKKKALAAAKELAAEGVPYASAWADYVRGASNRLDGNEEEALSLLWRSAQLLEKQGFVLHAQAVRYRVGRVLGGEDGARLEKQCRAAFERQSIRDLEGALAAFAPEANPE